MQGSGVTRNTISSSGDDDATRTCSCSGSGKTDTPGSDVCEPCDFSSSNGTEDLQGSGETESHVYSSSRSTGPLEYVACNVHNLPGSSSENEEKVILNLCKVGEDPKSPCEIVTLEMTKQLLQLEDRSTSSVRFIDNLQDSSTNVMIVYIQQEKKKVCDEQEDQYVTCQVPIGTSSSDECTSEESSTSNLGTCTCTETCGSEYGSTVDRFDYTLAIIKPEAMVYRREIEDMIAEEGFNVRQTRWLKLTPEQASDFYLDKYQRKDFARNVVHMSSGAVMVFVLCKEDAVQEWKNLMGPSKVLYNS